MNSAEREFEYGEGPDTVEPHEIRTPSRPLLTSPDARVLGGPTHHLGANYGKPDTVVTVVDGTQCVHNGEVCYGGESLYVPKVVAEFMIRSGWATAARESDSAREAAPLAKVLVKAPTKRQPA